MPFHSSRDRCVSRVLALLLPVSSTAAFAAPSELGQHPLCEASAALIVPCPGGSGQYLLVGDNEQRQSLFLFKIENGQVQTQLQQRVKLNLDDDTELSDIEALTALPDGQIGVFASHSRNTNCEAKKNRRRFGVIDALSPATTDLSVVATKRIGCESIIDADSKGDPLVQAVCDTIDDVESRADAIENGVKAKTLDEATAKRQCNEVMPYNAEGAVNLASTGNPDLWVGLRAPLLGKHPGDPGRKDLAILLHMKARKSYVFDRVALLDMGGRGVRDLAISDAWVWVIAGPPADVPEGVTVPFELRRFPADALSKTDVIEPERIDPDLPTSSEGLAVLGGQAIVVIDGDAGDDDATQCVKPSRVMMRPATTP
jgi:hypothetical protein